MTQHCTWRNTARETLDSWIYLLSCLSLFPENGLLSLTVDGLLAVSGKGIDTIMSFLNFTNIFFLLQRLKKKKETQILFK